MAIAFSILKSYVSGWLGPGNQRKILMTFPCALHARVAYVCLVHLLVQVTCIHCVTVENVLTQSPKTCVVNSSCMVVPAMSRQDTTRLPERACYSGSVPHVMY